MGHCHSVMHEYETTSFEYETIQIFEFSGGGEGGIEAWGEDSRAPHPLYETLFSLPPAVIEGDYAVCMRHLMHFPTVYEVNYLVQRALHLRNPVRGGLINEVISNRMT